MTRKNYIRFAVMIKEMNKYPSWTVYEFALWIADVLKEDNPLFDRIRFLSACGF